MPGVVVSLHRGQVRGEVWKDVLEGGAIVWAGWRYRHAPPSGQEQSIWGKEARVGLTIRCSTVVSRSFASVPETCRILPCIRQKPVLRGHQTEGSVEEADSTECSILNATISKYRNIRSRGIMARGNT